MASRRRLRVGILTGVALARAGVAASTTAQIEQVALRDGAAPVVELKLSAPLVKPEVHLLSSPPRVYVDLRGGVLTAKAARTLEGTGTVRRVRLGQFEKTTTRVVVDLAKPAAFDLSENGTTLALRFGGGTAAAPPAAHDGAPATAKHDAAPPPAVAKQPAVTPCPEAATPGPPPADVAAVPVARTEQRLAAHPSAPHRLGADLEEALARRYAADDFAGVVALYATQPTAIRRRGDSVTRAVVVDALRELGLVYSARKLLGPESSTEAPALRIARGELSLDTHAPNEAAAAVRGLDEAAMDPALVPRLRAVRVRLDLAHGDLDAASAGIGSRSAPELRAAFADTALGVGRTATERHACARALAAYRQALDVDAGRTARAAAAAGLVRAALGCENPDATMTGLGVLAESMHPLLRRAATVIATTQQREQATPGSDRRGG